MSEPNRVLVIGGTGVIGHFVLRALLARSIHPVVLTVTGRTDFVGDILDRIELVRGDVIDRPGVEAVVRQYRVGAIAHLGAILHQVTERDPPTAARVAVEGAANVLEAARVVGVRRVVFASSKAVYGPVTGRHAHPYYEPLTEDLPPSPASVYGITKYAAEMLGRWYAANHGLEFAALRFGSTVGPGKLMRHGSTSVHSRILEYAMAGLPVAVEKGGEAVTDTVWNGDVGEAIASALLTPRLSHDVYNIGTGRGVTLHEFAAAVRRAFPAADIRIGPGEAYLRPDSTGHCILDVSRAAADLGCRPDADLDRMVHGYLATMTTLGLAPAVTGRPEQAAVQGVRS